MSAMTDTRKTIRRILTNSIIGFANLAAGGNIGLVSVGQPDPDTTELIFDYTEPIFRSGGSLEKIYGIRILVTLIEDEDMI